MICISCRTSTVDKTQRKGYASTVRTTQVTGGRTTRRKSAGGKRASVHTTRFERRRLRNRVCRVSRHTVRARSVRAVCGS